METAIDFLDLNPIIDINHNIPIEYPTGFKPIVEESKRTGYFSYNIKDIDLSRPRQIVDMDGVTKMMLYEHLEKNNMIKKCLSLRDGEEFQKRGITFYQNFFQDYNLFLWKSVSVSINGMIRVPYLYLGGREIIIEHEDSPFYRYPIISSVRYINPKYVGMSWSVVFNNYSNHSMDYNDMTPLFKKK